MWWLGSAYSWWKIMNAQVSWYKLYIIWRTRSFSVAVYVRPSANYDTYERSCFLCEMFKRCTIPTKKNNKCATTISVQHSSTSRKGNSRPEILSNISLLRGNCFVNFQCCRDKLVPWLQQTICLQAEKEKASQSGEWCVSLRECVTG